MDRKRVGDWGEDLAARYLEEAGMRILHRKYRYGRTEVDLVAEDRNEIVFVEVKTRSSGAFGEPEESVSPAQERRLRQAAEGYCLQHDSGERFCRFDIVAIKSLNEVVVVKHIRNAF